jgi:hypothetical protein
MVDEAAAAAPVAPRGKPLAAACWAPDPLVLFPSLACEHDRINQSMNESLI